MIDWIGERILVVRMVYTVYIIRACVKTLFKHCECLCMLTIRIEPDICLDNKEAYAGNSGGEERKKHFRGKRLIVLHVVDTRQKVCLGYVEFSISMASLTMY